MKWSDVEKTVSSNRKVNSYIDTHPDESFFTAAELRDILHINITEARHGLEQMLARRNFIKINACGPRSQAYYVRDKKSAQKLEVIIRGGKIENRP